MQGVQDRILVRIDKKAQYDKRTSHTIQVAGGKDIKLEVVDRFTDFTRNLQYGEVVNVSSLALKKFPEVEVGDILIFSHIIEHRPNTTGDKTAYNKHLISQEENGDEILFAKIDEGTVYGVFKPSEGIIIPYKSKIFCHPHTKEAEFHQRKYINQLTGKEETLSIFNEWELKPDVIEKKLESLKREVENIRTGYQYTKYERLSKLPVNLMPNKQLKEYEKEMKFLTHRIEESEKKIAGIMKERAELTKLLHTSHYFEYTVLFINEETSNGWGMRPLEAGDKVVALKDSAYPLDFMYFYYLPVKEGEESARNIFNYSLINDRDVVLVKYKDSAEYWPLKDWVVVKADEPKRISPNGLIIPDSAIILPNTGVVYAAGPEAQVDVSDKIRFLRNKYVAMNLNGEEYLLMQDNKILWKENPVPVIGVEPTRISASDSKSEMSTNFIIPAF